MSTSSPNPDSPRVPADLADQEIVGFDALARRVRSRLQPGGPTVDPELLHALATNALPDEIRREVRQKIQTWLTWHEAYWTIRAELDRAEADQ